jgi:3-methyladenine DNA glycosylase/8-oxoguanine DNA glycosylase
VSSGPSAVEARLSPRSPLRLPARSAPDGTLRVRHSVISRLLHVDGTPVVVRAWLARGGEIHLHAAPDSKPASRDQLELAIDRMRFALGIDEDMSDFYARFKDDRILGGVIRRKPWIRPRRRPWPWEALLGAVCQQLIEADRALTIQRRIVRRWGPIGNDGLRDVPSPAKIAARAPAELAALDLAPKRATALIKAAQAVASGRIDPDDPATDRKLMAIREIGPWTSQMLALNGRGDPDSLPASDLGYFKLVGRLAGLGRRATVQEVEEFFAPYAPYRGLAGTFALVGLHRQIAQGQPLRLAA